MKLLSGIRSVILLFILFYSGKIFCQPVNQTGFENYPDQTIFNSQLLKAEGFNVPWTDGFNQNRAMIDHNVSHTGSNSLKITYPKGGFGPSQSGVQAPLKVKPQNQYYISYWLKFSDNFSFGSSSEGGKLPGLGGGDNCSGCIRCTGSNGFSARLMWRKNGKGILYLYEMNKKNLCGDEYTLKTSSGSDFYFQKGKWHNIIERVKINTGSQYDGEVEIWIDGKPSVAVAGIQFVTNGQKVDNLYFSTFHGGNTADWAPVNDSFVWFDDIIITTNYADIFAPLSIVSSLANDSLIIGPQPIMANSFISIHSKQNNNFKSVELLDTSSKLVAKGDVNQNSQFYIPRTSRGIYYLKLNNGQEVTIRKIYIE